MSSVLEINSLIFEGAGEADWRYTCLVGPESVAMATRVTYVLLFAGFDFTVPPVPLYINSHPDRGAEGGGGGGAKWPRETESHEETWETDRRSRFSLLNLITCWSMSSEIMKPLILRSLACVLIPLLHRKPRALCSAECLTWITEVDTRHRGAKRPEYSEIETRYCKKTNVRECGFSC